MVIIISCNGENIRENKLHGIFLWKGVGKYFFSIFLLKGEAEGQFGDFDACKSDEG